MGLIEDKSARRDQRGNIDPWYNTKGRNDGDNLVYLSVALNGACNIDCSFCYVDGSRPGQWNPDDLERVLGEARELGMEKIQLSGGEPTLYKHLFRIVEYLHNAGVETLLVTNGTTMMPDMAQRLHDNEVIVGISLESIVEEVDDGLTRSPGSFQKKMEAIRILKGVGYTEDIPLNIIVKTLKANQNTFLQTWQWALDNGLQPILDRAIPGPRLPIEDVMSPQDLRYVIDEIGKLQGVKHAIPFLYNEGCNRLECGVHIETNGDVLPCAGVKLPTTNVYQESLVNAWRENKLLDGCKTHAETIEGSCGSCDYAKICTGCRGVAYEIFGDVNAPDPLCWHYDPNDGYSKKLDLSGDKPVVIGQDGKIILPHFLERLKAEKVPDYMDLKALRKIQRKEGPDAKSIVIGADGKITLHPYLTEKHGTGMKSEG